MYIISFVIFFLCIMLFVKLLINIKVNVKLKENKLELCSVENMENKLTIKLGYFPIFKLKLFKDKKINDKKKNKKKINKGILLKNLLCYIKIKKFNLSLGFNTDDPIVNSKLNAYINMILCIAINKYQNVFDLKNIYYYTYISNEPFILNTQCIIQLNITDIIYVIIKTIKDERRKENGRASNRKFNGNRNEFIKRYDRC